MRAAEHQKLIAAILNLEYFTSDATALVMANILTNNSTYDQDIVR